MSYQSLLSYVIVTGYTVSEFFILTNYQKYEKSDIMLVDKDIFNKVALGPGMQSIIELDSNISESFPHMRFC